MRAVRKCDRSSSGWNGGDIDELVVLFRNAMTSDGNHPSKSSRNHLLEYGYAVRIDGLTALTGRGKIAALFCWPMPRVWLSLWRRYRHSPFHRQGQHAATR